MAIWYWLRNGKPEPVEGYNPEFETWWANYDNRNVAQTEIPDPSAPDRHVRVSTVFLSLDHNYLDDGPPILWETMVFGGPMDHYQERYRSDTDARVGHERIVADVRAALSRAH